MAIWRELCSPSIKMLSINAHSCYWLCNFGAGLDAFVLPHKLVSTGISGVGLILYYLTGLSVGSWNVILNVPIFWAAWKWLGKRVVLNTLYGTLMLSWMIDLFSFLQ